MADFLVKILITLGLAAVAVGINLVFHLKDDNKIEEVLECIVQEETGIDIDFTPDSPEEPVEKNKDGKN